MDNWVKFQGHVICVNGRIGRCVVARGANSMSPGYVQIMVKTNGVEHSEKFMLDDIYEIYEV